LVKQSRSYNREQLLWKTLVADGVRPQAHSTSASKRAPSWTDSIGYNEVLTFLPSSDLKPMRTSFRHPWQNGVAKRWVGSARRELLDHVIPLNEHHLRRLRRNHLSYCH
jgi:hypothetical protein